MKANEIVISEARPDDAERLIAHNTAAIQLYQKFGFQVEGRRQRAIYQGGEYLDDLMMALLLDDSPKLQEILERGKAQIQAGEGIEHEIFWEEVETEGQEG